MFMDYWIGRLCPNIEKPEYYKSQYPNWRSQQSNWNKTEYWRSQQ